MKTFLVPVEPHEKADRIISLAAKMATKMSANLTGFALRRAQVAAIGWDPASVAIVTDPEWDDQRPEAEARELFARVMTEHGLVEDGDGSRDAARWSWYSESGSGDEFLGSFGRAFDLTVVGQPSGRPGGSAITTLEAALFDSGGPVLVSPKAPVETFGSTVVVVWNGSSETARTIAFAKPLLHQAEKVVVFDDDGTLGHRPDGAAVVRRLIANGISAELRRLRNGSVRSGETILAEAASVGADLLVKGAYTQSRLRQMIFGGATRHLIAESPLPVFLAH
ncbi:universal stress protein [Amorphus orientalis]|uniref:Nucleotide-binding universal stress UspA family protein n=1 Tax=Amorphus orientalis TaxID=649198 RepID=A0AAE3VSD3_9HYPH|nr:universal stress protein [Amorphus orientalis]MDQ0317303.1 nucleotide-binding universal stress UspA family protein [Amorphus orientalis]